MIVEVEVFNALSSLAAGRVYPDVAPADAATPYITYQAVGGEPVNFLSGDAPGKTNTRMQVNVWAASRLEASALGEQVEAAIRGAAHLQPEVASGRVATYDESTGYRGVMQDFSLWI